MKNFLLTTVAIIAAGAIACFVFFRVHCDPALHAAAGQRDAMAWLRTEFHLSDVQFAAIRRLHDSYSIECEAHCAAIMAARAQIASLEKSAQSTAALDRAQRQLAKQERECRDATRGHLERVAALMPPGQGDRYLQILLPRVVSYRHQGAPTLRLDK